MLANDTASRRTRGGALAVRACLFALFLAAIGLSGCNNPQAPAPGTDDYRGSYDPSPTGLLFRLESPSGDGTPFLLQAADLRFDPQTRHLRAQVSIHNGGSKTVPGPEGVAVFDFVPTDVRLVDSLCTPRDTAGPLPALPGCLIDYRGKYGADGQLSPGETSSAVEWIIIDPSGESFSFRARLLPGTKSPNGVIAGVVFADRNRDGKRQPGERGVPGTAVTLHHGDASAGAATDSSGHYSFTVQEPGLYELVKDAHPGWIPTTPSRLQVLVVRRPDSTLSGFDRGDFGLVRQDTNTVLVVEGVVFNDVNRNGQRERGEPGIPGVVLQGSTRCPTLVPIEARTDERGMYVMRLPGLECGPPWIVQLQPMRGFVTTPNPVVFDSPPPPDGRFRADFGVAAAPPDDKLLILGRVFRDDNANGQQESGEPGVAGVGVSASGMCMTPISAYTHTDAQGRFELKGGDVHCPLPWIVSHEPVPNTRDTTPNPVILPEPPGGDSNVFLVMFGVAPDSTPPPPPPPHGFTIEGTVFLDLNRNSVRDPGELGVPGVELQLISPATVHRAVNTDLAGHYRFEAREVGFAPVMAVVQSRPVFPLHTTPNPAPVDPATPPGTTLGIDFGVGIFERQ